MASIQLENVGKSFPNGHVAAKDLNLDIADGEFMVLVGPSGCGKSTALRMIAGLETPSSGRILIGDRDVTRLPPQERDLAMVFQNYAIYPHKTVRDNLAFGLRMRKTDPDVIKERIERAAKKLELDKLLDRKPRQLSGGQRQRVALGRAIVREPKAFLLDEPLSNLDAKLRVQTRAELSRMHRDLKATSIYVTHDQEEAMTLGDRVAVMRDGKIQQTAPPMEVYRRPANVFVAGFIGLPSMNFFECNVRQSESTTLVSPHFEIAVEESLPSDKKLILGIRPHDVRQVEAARADVKAIVDVVQPLGADLLVHLRFGSDEGGWSLAMVTSADDVMRPEETIDIGFVRDRMHFFDKETGERLN